jgi:glycosyltransferase involved in cell wall biosynthesis
VGVMMHANPLPVVYVVNPAIAVTGGFVAIQHAAIALADNVRMVLVLPKDTQVTPDQLGHYWRVDYLPMATLSRSVSAMLTFLPSLIAVSWQLKKRMRADGAHSLILNDFYLMHGAMLRLLGFRGLIISWVRCDPWRYAGPLARLLLWCMARSANRVVAVSRYIQTLLPMNSTLLYDYFYAPQPATTRMGATHEKLFVYVGNYIRGKGQDMAIEAFAIAAAEDASLTLHFYGGDMGLAKNRDYRHALEQQVSQKGLRARVTFAPFLPNMDAVLATAYAALNFSHSESFSMTVLEASGAGLPVIATQSGGPQEIIEQGVTGYLVPVGDVAAAAERMLHLAKHPDIAQAMGQQAALQVRQHFSQADYCAQMKAILNLA